MTKVTLEGFPERVRIVDVGPRDGLQAWPAPVPTDVKIEMINGLIAAGVPQLEVTSFVAPRAVPNMADAAEVMAAIDRSHGAELTALVPNARGAARAIEAGVDAMVVFLSASESHNQANVNCSRDVSLAAAAEIARMGQEAGIAVYGAIATAFGCPFEGDVPVADIVHVAKAYADNGITRISLGDTTGMATPRLVQDRCRALAAEVPQADVALHFHNTRGVGLACAYAGLREGITRYEASVAGIGGCPFAPGATGNICTEDLVYLLHESGVETGIDLEALIDVARRTEAALGQKLPGQVMKAGPRLRQYRRDEVRSSSGSRA
ncbi:MULTISPECIES: hydroxymethylglutaryl-CoA lyase [unclassified Salipiger]|uniref:hydroxymethylglutaryl-CoA lyase n=1 Tax=unclassified Salipiger TaxID=2640570 RepID=UPI0013BAFDC6|nr:MULTISPECIES: hydroxymethylglutaryl-CoA lyase [unclassified Salipiger]NDV48953.1 hydroxymethylglutaryl-CoA lyase [Salipiger sp. PrR003]NDW31216.1 hydroxymethylglutaryl-CoA lyase [Salipiger sp. PrR007]